MTNIELFMLYEKDNEVHLERRYTITEECMVYCTQTVCRDCSIFKTFSSSKCLDLGIPILTIKEFEELKPIFPEYFI